MAEGIKGAPNVYGAGLDFDYSVWTAGTRLDLVNVPWNNDYRDVVRFSNRNALNSYIDGLAPSGITIENLTYAKPGQDIFIGIPYNRVNRYNYLRAHNPLMPVGGDIQKDFYYFILECEFVNPGVTRIRVQLDVWQTYIYDVQFGNCYVERGHIGIANTNAFNNYGRDYLTVPEGLDIGGEYQQIVRRSDTVMRNALARSEGDLGDILVISAVDLKADGGTVDDPKLNAATGSFVNGLPSGADIYWFSDPTFYKSFIATIADKPWLSQGIISVIVVPSLSRYWGSWGLPSSEGQKLDGLYLVPSRHSFMPNWRNNSEIINAIPERYRNLKKFFTFPYMAIEMTTWTGNPAVLKPELWNNPDAMVFERLGVMPPNTRAEFYPRGYNARNGAPVDNLWGLTDAQLESIVDPNLREALRDGADDSGEYLDTTVRMANFPALPVINNMAIDYLAANKNQIAFNYQNADWAQQRALAGAQAQYDIATGAIGTNTRSGNIAQGTNQAAMANNNRTLAAQAIVNSISQGASGVGSALTPGGAGGSAIVGLSQAGATGINAGIQTAANDAALGITNRNIRQNVANENQQSALVRDTNIDLAKFAARGDYANDIAGINAKIQDAKLIQPSVSGQFGGEAINIEHDKLEISLRWKMLDYASMRIVGEYWLRFGYAIHSFINVPQDLKVMSKFTYWKMTQTYIKASNIPEGHKQAIRGILEKGFTNWSNPGDIGVIDIADNAPLGGISY